MPGLERPNRCDFLQERPVRHEREGQQCGPPASRRAVFRRSWPPVPSPLCHNPLPPQVDSLRTGRAGRRRDQRGFGPRSAAVAQQLVPRRNSPGCELRPAPPHRRIGTASERSCAPRPDEAIVPRVGSNAELRTSSTARQPVDGHQQVLELISPRPNISDAESTRTVPTVASPGPAGRPHCPPRV